MAQLKTQTPGSHYGIQKPDAASAAPQRESSSGEFLLSDQQGGRAKGPFGSSNLQKSA
jgi:hypothetical protein